MEIWKELRFSMFIFQMLSFFLGLKWKNKHLLVESVFITFKLLWNPPAPASRELLVQSSTVIHPMPRYKGGRSWPMITFQGASRDKPCSSVPGNQWKLVGGKITAIKWKWRSWCLSSKMENVKTWMKPCLWIGSSSGHSDTPRIAATEIPNMTGVAIEYKSG